MTKRTNAELIADLRSPEVFNRTVMLRAAERLEAAGQRAAELAAVLMRVEDFVTRHYLDTEMGRRVIEVLAVEPGDALREHDAELIEELADEMPVTTLDGFGTNRFASGKESRDWLREKARQRREGTS